MGQLADGVNWRMWSAGGCVNWPMGSTADGVNWRMRQLADGFNWRMGSTGGWGQLVNLAFVVT
jgi:hypothetical protein